MIPPKITSLKTLPDYKLQLHYENGEKKICDVKPYIFGPYYGALAEVAYFNRAKICEDGFHVEWPDEQNLPPDDVYRLGELIHA
jgi:hypothetical protein